MTFLDRLIARATGRLEVLKNAPALAQELDHPAYGAPRQGEPDAERAVAPVAARPAQAMPTRPAVLEPGPDATPVTRRAAVPLRNGQPRIEPALPGIAAPAPAETPVPPAPGSVAALRAPPQPAMPSIDPLPRPRPTDSERTLNEQPAVADPVQPMPRPVPVQPLAARPMPPEAPPQDKPSGHRDFAPSPPDLLEIHLEIGRIDLVSPQPARPQPTTASRHARPGPHLTLADYLDRRRGSR